jgi:thiol-disulfide isomerase/thioredoxin
MTGQYMECDAADILHAFLTERRPPMLGLAATTAASPSGAANEVSAMNLRTKSVLSLIVLVCALAPARSAPLQSPPAGNDAKADREKENQRALLDQAFHSLEDELKAAIEDYQAQIQAASKSGTPREQFPASPTPGFYDRFEQLALQDQPDALRWCIGISGSIGFPMDEAIARKLVLYEHMVKAHAASRWTDDTITFLSQEGAPTGIGVPRAAAFLTDIAKANTNPQTRAKALWFEGALFLDSKKPEEKARASAVWRELVAQCPGTPQAKRAAGILFAEEHLQVGMTAPDVSTVDPDGAAFKLSDFRGKVTVLVFWGFWCAPCRAMLPHEQALVERYKDKPFALVGVNTDMNKDEYKQHAQQMKVTWKQSWQGNRQGPWPEAWGITSFPTVIVVDAQGVIRAIDTRGETLPKGDALEKLVDQLLAEPPPKKSGDAPAPK